MAQRMVVQPNLGDLIEIDREGYQHWAIYVGDGYVIHFTTPNGAGSSSKSVLNDKGIVKKEKLSCVVGDDTYRINNRLDDKYEPRDVEIILKDAESRVGQVLPYDVIQYNCEHFVTELRYGMPESRQGRRAMAMVVGLGAAAIGVSVLAGSYALSKQEENNKKKNKEDEDREGGGSA